MRILKSLTAIVTGACLAIAGCGIAQATPVEQNLLDITMHTEHKTIDLEKEWIQLIGQTDNRSSNTGYNNSAPSTYRDMGAKAESDTAKKIIRKEFGKDFGKIDYIINNKVDNTLDLSGSEQQLLRSTAETLSLEDQYVMNTLPTVSHNDGAASLPNPDTREMFRIQPADSAFSYFTEGVSITKSRQSDITNITHITNNEKGQIVSIIKNPSIDYIDFDVSLPSGYHLIENSNNGYNLVNDRGSIEGTITKPWAYDASGKQLITKYEMLTTGTIRQIINTENAVYPIVADPTWEWWVATAARCAADVAPLLVTGGAAIASRAPKLISFINKLAKTPRLAKAIQKAGGVKEAAVAIAKKAIQQVRNSVPESLRNKLPNVSLNQKEKAALAVLWPFVLEQIWDLLGVGGCVALIRGY